MKCKRCNKSEGTICDSCIHVKQRKMKEQIHARNKTLRQLNTEIARLQELCARFAHTMIERHYGRMPEEILAVVREAAAAGKEGEKK